MLRVPSVVATLAVSTLFAGAAFAQTPTPQDTQAPTTTLTSTTRNVLVDVVVLDKDGKPVSGLKKEDFRVFEDGKPQTVNYFESAFPASGAAATVTHTPLPPNTFTNIPAVAPNNAVNVLMMDGLNTNMGDQVYVHKEMVRFLASIPPDTRIGILLLSEHLRIIQGITQDSTLLRAALARLAANPTQSALMNTIGENEAQEGAVNMIMQQGIDTGSTQVQASATALQNFLAQQNTFQTNMRSMMTMEALQTIARYLAGIPGRKNLIWFAGSFPACLGTDCPTSYMEAYKKTVDALANARVSVYPIDARGVTLNLMHDVEFAKPPGGAANTQQLIQSQADSLNADANLDAVNYGNSQLLAKDTGGKANQFSNDFKDALASDIDHGSRYYTLAYTPTNNKKTGKERKIEIKIPSGKYKLAYRRGYYEDSIKAQATASVTPNDPLRQLMDRGMPNFTELSYRENIEPAQQQPAADAPSAGDNAALKAPFTRYTVNFALFPDGLTLVPGSDGVRHGKIEVAMVAYNQEGKALNWKIHLMLSLIHI